MTLQSFIRKAKRFTPQKAWVYFRKGIWFTDSILLLARPAGLPEPGVQPFAGELRAVTEADLPDCAAFEDAAHYVPVYREMLRKGDLVLFGYLNGACVFRCCLQCGGIFFHAGLPVQQLSANEAYVHYVFCAPSARRKGFHEAALRHMCTIRPGDILYAMVKEDNIPSLRGFFRTGFRPVSRFTAKSRFFRRSSVETPLSNGEVVCLGQQMPNG